MNPLVKIHGRLRIRFRSGQGGGERKKNCKNNPFGNGVTNKNELKKILTDHACC